LVDIDVRSAFVVKILFDVQGYGRPGDGAALKPADALEGEDCVGVVGEGLVHDPIAGEVFEGYCWWCCHLDCDIVKLVDVGSKSRLLLPWFLFLKEVLDFERR